MVGAAAGPLGDWVFRVVADFDPSSLPRITGLLSLANVSPASLHCERRASDKIYVLALVEAIPESATDLILRKLSQLTCVHECSVEILP